MCLPGTIETVRRQLEAGDAPEIESPRIDRRTALLGAAGAALAAAFPAGALAAKPKKKKKLVDLTHPFTTDFPTFLGLQPTRESVATIADNGFYGQKWTFGEHTATHMDAPGHFTEGGRLSTQIKPSELMVPIVVIHIHERAAADPDTVVTPGDLRRFERRYGRIPKRALVCMHSGWDAKVNDPAAFKGGDAFPSYHFPGFGLEAVQWLLDKRNVTGIGVDTMSLDPGNSSTFPVHVNFLGADKYGLEGLNNLAKIPPRGATAYVGLIPWQEGSGGPCRVIAQV